jgi:hypothetical protein
MAKRSNRLELTLSDEQWDRLDGARGHEPRASFVKRALESALDSRTGVGAAHDVASEPVPVPAPSRTPARRKPSVRETWAR